MLSLIFHSPFFIFNVSLTTLILVLGAALFYAAYLVIRFNRQIARLSNAFIRMPASQKVVFIMGVTIATVSAQKGGTNGTDQASSTNNGEAVSSPLVTNLTTASPLSVTDVERGYRLESVTLNPDVSYAMPDGAAVVGTWNLTGAFEDVVRVGIREQGLGISGWSFPLGAHLCDYLWAYTWGKVRPQLKNASNEIAAVGTPMSTIPQVSRFWTAATTNGSWLLTWENFALGRIEVSTNSYSPFPDPSSLVSAQLELCRNGDFVARSNNVESVYRRVNPDDWDDDGIPNEEDDEPFVCGEESFGAHQVLPTDSTTNFYYWVDLVVSQANARVIFEGDGDSNLADPSFIAKAGETNRVYLLIGKTYSISCAMPILCVNKEDEDVEVYPDDNGLHICWDISLEFVFEPPLMMAGPMLAASSGGGGTRAKIRPERARGGAFSWTGTFCCYHFATDGSPVFTCSGNCGCGGYCNTGNITYTYVGYSRDFDGWSCSCRAPGEDDDPQGGDDDPDDPPTVPSVSAWFSKSAIIFEDEYEPSEGVTVPRRSTESKLTCYAYGGPSGGLATFEVTGDARLLRMSGRTLPFTQRLAPYETLTEEIYYQGKKGAASEVKVTGSFVSNDPDEQVSDSIAPIDVVEVEIMRQVAAPENDCPYRHKFGVLETITCNHYPPSAGLTWSISEGASIGDNGVCHCPAQASSNPLVAHCGDATFTPNITVVEPDGIEARNPRCLLYGVQPGRAGWIGLRQEFHVTPLDVSFSQIVMEEVPSQSGGHEGYFANEAFRTNWYHSGSQGAGVWCGVRATDNRMGDHDDAALTMELLRLDSSGNFTDNTNCTWCSGWITWNIPFGWAAAQGNSPTTPIRTFDPGAGHKFEIWANGDVSVRKFGNEAKREISGVTKLNGVVWTGN